MHKELICNTIYICTKLFNYNDKLQAEYLEKAIKKRIKCDIFMPFRDTNENNLKGPNRTKIVYDSDIERLNSGKIVLLAVLYDGICKDEGISFEIGYAYGKGIPAFIINTDFIWYAVGKKEFLFDPVISEMCFHYLHQYHIIDSDSFYSSLLLSQNTAFDLAAEQMEKILSKSSVSLSKEEKRVIKNDVFIDFGGGKFEYQREYSNWLKGKLNEIGISVEIANRYFVYGENSGKVDIQHMLESNIYVCLGDEAELNSGSAALLGLAKCNHKKIILYESSDIEIHGENGHRMKKNLIIDFSIDRLARTKQEIIDIIVEEMQWLKN